MRSKVFNNKPFEECYGCQACAQICPHGAIDMKPNEEGFLYPNINATKCIDCGLCQKVCPTQDENTSLLFHLTPQYVEAAWNVNLSERLESTSGGVFFLLANVYGADYKKDLSVYHRRIENIETLKRLRGSKYVQSDIGDVFIQVKSDLKAGKKVLFSGTPCQIAGLRLFLRKPFDNLYTIDLVCHGVPSLLLFKQHIAFLEDKYKDSIIDFKFRAKKKSGWRSYVEYVFKKNKPTYTFLGKDYYSHAFHLGYFNRESCYTCVFSKSKRVGDITLSDFWGAENHYKELNKARKWGFNCVMCNTPKGHDLFNSIKKKVRSKKYLVELAIQGDVRLRHAEERPRMRENAYKMLLENGYKFMVSKYGIKESIIQRFLPTWIKNLIREIQSRL